jgi:hypothetical protein
MAYISRVIDDVDSSYYYLKYNCLKYIRSFIEGLENKKNKKIVEFMGSNVNQGVLYNLMMILVKKLFVREKLRRELSNKKKSHDRVTRKKADSQIGVANGISKEFNVDTSKLIKEHHNDTLKLNNSESFISDKLANSVRIRSLSELELMYIETPKFSEHILIKIVQSIYVFMQNLRTQSYTYEAFLDEKNEEASRFFPNYRLNN